MAIDFGDGKPAAPVPDAPVPALEPRPGIFLGAHRDFSEVADVLRSYLPPVRRTESRWFTWGGQVWAHITEEALSALARPILDRCWYEEARPQGPPVRRDLHPTKGYISEALAALSALPGVWVREEPDANTDELITPSGRVQLASGEVLPHDASAWATKLTPTEYVPEPDPPTDARWLAHLESLELGPEMVDYLHRSLGYALTGRGTEKAFWFLYGRPHTGKSTLLFLALHVLGRTTDAIPGYCAQTNADAWIETRASASGHTDSLMPIAGARLVYVDETPENCRFNSGLLKTCTSGMGAANRIRLSAKREKGFDCPSTFALFFSSNHMPGTQDEGTLSRLKLIQHDKVIEVIDPAFFQKFLTPAMRRAILRWLVQGARRYLSEGLTREPAAIAANRAEYQAENDTIGIFIRECVEFAPALRCKAGELRQAYINWAKRNEVRYIPSRTAWGKAIRERLLADPSYNVEKYSLGGSVAFKGCAASSDWYDRGEW